MGKKEFIILFITIIFLPIRVFAREVCSYDSQSKMQKISSNIATSYDYIETFNPETGFSDVTFTVYLSNINNMISIYDTESNKIIENTPSNEIVISNQQPGKYLKYYIYGNIDGCREIRISTIYVTLPNFNKYYSDPICRNIPDYELCNKWSQVNLTYKDFSKKVNVYLSGLVEETKPGISVNNITIFEKIINFLANYSLVIFGSIIIICAGLIYYLIRKDEFDLTIKK
ncbi:MAG: hypothetical protein RR708_01160 [Bacilli bacterium]